MLFELGNTFHDGDGDLPREDRRLAFLLAGPRAAWIGDGEPLDFYDGKGVVETIVTRLGLPPPTALVDDALDVAAPWLHPRRRATIAIGTVAVGSVGELHPGVADALELDCRAIYADLSVDALFDVRSATGDPNASPLPRFPAVHRDIALELDDAHPAGRVAAVIRAAGGGLVEDVRLFDLYRGEQVTAGHKSLAFRVTYRDRASTLTDKRVDAAHTEVGAAVKAEFGAQVR
jgi:phenylalanyl-tRNA synthetase beta chain